MMSVSPPKPVVQYPRQESNLVLDLRTVACFRHTPKIKDWHSAGHAQAAVARGRVGSACRLREATSTRGAVPLPTASQYPSLESNQDFHLRGVV